MPPKATRSTTFATSFIMLHTFRTYLQRHTLSKRLCLVAMGYALVIHGCLGAGLRNQHGFAEQKDDHEKFANLFKTIRYVNEENIDKLKQLLQQDPSLPAQAVQRNINLVTYTINVKRINMAKIFLAYGFDAKMNHLNSSIAYHNVMFCQDEEDILYVVKALVKRGLHINTTNEFKQNLLHLAALYGKNAVLYYLLQRGLDSLAQDNQGNTPLHYCCQTHNLEGIQLLTSTSNTETLLGTDNGHQMTPMEIAQVKNDNEAVVILQTQAKLSYHVFRITEQYTRENASHVIPSVISIIISYIMFQ